MELQVGVKVVLMDEEGRVLLIKRVGELEGKWDIPGGRIHAGSSLMDNLLREVEEETKLPILSEPKLIAAQDILLSEIHVVRLTYTARASGVPVLDPNEHQAFQWVPFSELFHTDRLDRYVRTLLESGILNEDSWS